MKGGSLLNIASGGGVAGINYRRIMNNQHGGASGKHQRRTVVLGDRSVSKGSISGASLGRAWTSQQFKRGADGQRHRVARMAQLTAFTPHQQHIRIHRTAIITAALHYRWCRGTMDIGDREQTRRS
jgi:hypothetical protein